MGIRLLPYQHELRKALMDNSVVVVEKSRRTGYSWGAAWVAAGYAAKPKSQKGMNVYYMGYNLEMAREFVEYVGEAGKKLELGASAVGETLWQDGDPDQQIKAFRVDFRHGRVVALPSKPRSLRGMQGLVILDEAAFHDDLAELLKAALALTVWGGKVLIISTHDGEDNPFNELVVDIRAGKKPYKLLRCDFDRAIHEGLYKRVCERDGRAWSPNAEAAWREEIVSFYGDGAEEELFCIPRRIGGPWLPRALIESCMEPAIPVVTWTPPDADFVDWPLEQAYREVQEWCERTLGPLLATLPKGCRHYFGNDFGRSGDLSTFWPLTELSDLNLHTPFVLELRNAPFRTQEQIIFYMIDRLPLFSGGALDARGNGQALAEYVRQRYSPELIAEVMLSVGWYRENMPRLKAHLEDRTVSLPKNTQTLDDFRLIKVIQGVPRIPDNRTRDAGGQRHGDSAVALALGLFAKHFIEPPVEWEVHSTGKSRTSQILSEGYWGNSQFSIVLSPQIAMPGTIMTIIRCLKYFFKLPNQSQHRSLGVGCKKPTNSLKSFSFGCISSPPLLVCRLMCSCLAFKKNWACMSSMMTSLNFPPVVSQCMT